MLPCTDLRNPELLCRIAAATVVPVGTSTTWPSIVNFNALDMGDPVDPRGKKRFERNRW